jgi:hypothetical protein
MHACMTMDTLLCERALRKRLSRSLINLAFEKIESVISNKPTIMATLDDETKAKYCEIYRSFTTDRKDGAFDMSTAKELGRNYMADNIVTTNGGLPKIEGLEAWNASMDQWANTLAMVHDIQHIWCTDDGWVTVIVSLYFTCYNADKSKIVAVTTPGMNRVHINEEGKIDIFESHWDTSLLLQKLA